MSASMPPVSEEFFNKLKEAHPPLRPTPNMSTMDEIMFDAGKQELIDWIEQYVGGSTVTGTLNRHAD